MCRSLKIEFFCERKLWMVSFLGVASYNHPQGSPFRYSQDFETKFFREACRISTLEVSSEIVCRSDPSPPFPPSSSLLSSSSEEEEEKEEKEEEHAQNTNPLFPFLEE